MDTIIIEDALFAAIAAVGFSSISHLPKRAYPYCAVIAALSHSLRYIVMQNPEWHMHIFPATLLASFFTGISAVFLSHLAKTPAEACFFPSLLPMIPGMYAYRTFGAIAACIFSDTPDTFSFYFYQFAHNGFICISVLTSMVVGSTIPISIFKKVSFQATR